jgi:hypothetical protein
MKNVKINIEDIDFTKPVIYYCDVYGLSANAIRNRFKKLQIYNKFIFVGSSGKNMKILRDKLFNEYLINPKLCKECSKQIEYKNKENDFCSHCCAMTYIQRENPRKMSEKQKKILSIKLKEYWGKNPIPKIKIKCKLCNKEFEVINYYKNKRRFCSRKCASKGKDNSNCGGFRGYAGNGGKHGWYKGYYCQSSWELAWVIYNLDNDIKFKRNTRGFECFYDKKVHKFYPDFYLEDLKTFVEIKGRIRNDDVEKIKQFKENLIVLYKKEMKPILNYVIQKYGINFIELYDGNPYKKIKKNKCLLCGEPAKFKYCSRQCGCKAAQQLSPYHKNNLM